MGYQAPITAFDMFSKSGCWNPGGGTTDQSRATDVRINFRENFLLGSNILKNAFLGVFGVLQRLFQSFRWLDSVHDDVCVLNRSAQLIQTLTDQSGSTGRGRPVAVEQSYLKTRTSENDRPSATDKANADYCNFSRHFR